MFFSFSIKTFSAECKKDTLVYFDFDIDGLNTRRIGMCGFVKSLDGNKISKKTGKDFLRTFYEQAYFVPLYFVSNDSMKWNLSLIKDSILKKEIEPKMGSNCFSCSLMSETDTETETSEVIIILENEEIVLISAVKIVGDFLFLRKEEIEIPSSTLEWSVDEMKIDSVCMPIKIDSYKILSKRCIKNYCCPLKMKKHKKTVCK
ncbi:MAG TPA: hypothetical protein PLN63_09545, partial [Paludibacteraceae bacterium]|nr:hypothetical protein [Paludibacteraceae bacterium]